MLTKMKPFFTKMSYLTIFNWKTIIFGSKFLDHGTNTIERDGVLCLSWLLPRGAVDRQQFRDRYHDGLRYEKSVGQRRFVRCFELRGSIRVGKTGNGNPVAFAGTFVQPYFRQAF